MKKSKILSSLNKIANILDQNKYVKEADQITNVMIKISQNEDDISKIFRDMSSNDDKITSEINERNLRTHRIVLEYMINDNGVNNQKQFITTVTKTNIIKRAALEYVIDNNNLKSGDSFTLNIKAINPRSQNKIWEVEYDVSVYDDEKISFDANPLISKHNYDMQDITEYAGSDFIKDIVERSMNQPSQEDPSLKSVRENLISFPGDDYEKAYNVGLDEVREMYRMYDLPLDDPNIDEMAKEIAERFSNSDDKTEENLNLIIDMVMMEMMPETEID